MKILYTYLTLPTDDTFRSNPFIFALISLIIFDEEDKIQSSISHSVAAFLTYTYLYKIFSSTPCSETKSIFNFLPGDLYFSRSQWPRRLRYELSSLPRTLWSWVRIPLKAWVSVWVYSVFVLPVVPNYVYQVSINPIIQIRTHHISQANPPAPNRDNILVLLLLIVELF
jgi:hypothetical protein